MISFAFFIFEHYFDKHKKSIYIMKNIFYSLITIFLLVSCTKEQTQETNQDQQNNKQSQAESPVSTNTNDGIFSLAIEKAEVNAGEEICVDITGKNFKSIVSMQYTLRWDPNLLAFKDLRNFNLKALSKQNFNTTRAEKGLVIKSWFDPAIQGINVKDGNQIYSICFDAIGTSGSESYIYFSGDPTIIEMSDPSGEINFKSEKSSIAIK